MKKGKNMKADYWHNLWETKDIGFHMEDVNNLLLRFFPLLKLQKNSRVFIPLCGKTVDKTRGQKLGVRYLIYS